MFTVGYFPTRVSSVDKFYYNKCFTVLKNYTNPPLVSAAPYQEVDSHPLQGGDVTTKCEKDRHRQRE